MISITGGTMITISTRIPTAPMLFLITTAEPMTMVMAEFKPLPIPGMALIPFWRTVFFIESTAGRIIDWISWTPNRTLRNPLSKNLITPSSVLHSLEKCSSFDIWLMIFRTNKILTIGSNTTFVRVVIA